MHIIKITAKILATLLLIGILTSCMIVVLFYRYITESVMPSEKVQMNLETMPVNLSSKLYYKDTDTGEWVEWYTLQNTENREWADYNEIPDNFKKTFVAIEDERFWSHPGIDIKRTVAAGLNFITGRRVFGGSTITQQLIKNLSGDNEVTINRKITEICRAIKLEQTYSKEQILEWYMNIIYFGNGQYGISAAAQYYFDKELSELTLAETCAITGITNNPSKYNPYSYPENTQKRVHLILDKMLELEAISQTEHDESYKEDLVYVSHSQQQKSGAIVYPWYVDTVIEDVLAYFQENLQVSREQATKMLYYGGYEIYTCIDMRIQHAIDETYQNPDNIPKTRDNIPLQSSMTILDPYTGDITGIAGAIGEKKISRGLNWASGNLGRRPPGSSIKPIAVYGPAMDKDLIGPYSYFMDNEHITLTGTDWMPQNDSRTYNGSVNIHTAIVKSLNTVAAQVMDLLTPTESYKFLTKNLQMNLEPADQDYAPLAVGQLSIGTNTREMAEAYSIFPTNGVYRQGRTFSHINDHNGILKYENKPGYHRAIKENTATWMTSILQDAVSYGTGTAAKLKNMPTAGKTGTTTNARDRWFAGYTPYYIGVVWTGYETPKTMHVNGNPAAKIWKQVMEKIHEDLPAKSFTSTENMELPGPKLPPIEETLPEKTHDAEIDNQFDYQTENPTQQENPEWWESHWENQNQTEIPEQTNKPNANTQEPDTNQTWPPEQFIEIDPNPITITPIEPVEPKQPTEQPKQPNYQSGQILDPWTLQPIS